MRRLPLAVWVLMLANFVTRAGGFVIPFLAIYLSQSRGWSESTAAAALGAYGLGSAIAVLWGGVVADRIGRKPVLVVAPILGGARS